VYFFSVNYKSHAGCTASIYIDSRRQSPATTQPSVVGHINLCRRPREISEACGFNHRRVYP